MRISSAVVIASAQASRKKEGNRKVPPRHPSQRLTTLINFGIEWCHDNLRNIDPDSVRGDRLADRFETRFTIWGAKLRKLVEEDCFYFDPDAPNGGPAPSRSRRAMFDESKLDTDDVHDDLLRYDQTNPIRGLKQITTGFWKWSRRYIAECPGQPTNKHHAKRAKTLYSKILAYYKLLVQRQEEKANKL